jgi:hypothetical protein
MVGDPFRVLPLDAIRDVRNEALNHRDGDTFIMHGYTFVMPGALLRANTRLMLANAPRQTAERSVASLHAVVRLWCPDCDRETDHDVSGRPVAECCDCLEPHQMTESEIIKANEKVEAPK